jgi:hypothetical protein
VLRRARGPQVSSTTLSLTSRGSLPAPFHATLSKFCTQLMNSTSQGDIDAPPRVAERSELGLNTAGPRGPNCRQLMTD